MSRYYIGNIPFSSELYHHGIIGQKWGVKNGPPYPIKGFKSPTDLTNHMKSFKYSEFTSLKSADEVGRTRKGSCHDQVMYEFQQLRRMGKDPHGIFVMEYNDKTNQGGMTHSLAYYQENGKTNWVENAWSERAGVTSYNSINAIRNEIRRAHKSGEFGNRSEYNKLVFGSFEDSEHKIGEDLQELVDICLK